MDKITSPQELASELNELLAYAKGPSPSRKELAGRMANLANRVAASEHSAARILFTDNRLAFINYDAIIKELERRYDSFDSASFDIVIKKSVKVVKTSPTWTELEVPVIIQLNDDPRALVKSIETRARIGFGDTGDGDGFGFTFNLIDLGVA